MTRLTLPEQPQISNQAELTTAMDLLGQVNREIASIDADHAASVASLATAREQKLQRKAGRRNVSLVEYAKSLKQQIIDWVRTAPGFFVAGRKTVKFGAGSIKATAQKRSVAFDESEAKSTTKIKVAYALDQYVEELFSRHPQLRSLIKVDIKINKQAIQGSNLTPEELGQYDISFEKPTEDKIDVVA